MTTETKVASTVKPLFENLDEQLAVRVYRIAEKKAADEAAENHTALSGDAIARHATQIIEGLFEQVQQIIQKTHSGANI